MSRLLWLLCLAAGEEACQLQITSNWGAELAFNLVKDLAKKLYEDEGPTVELTSQKHQMAYNETLARELWLLSTAAYCDMEILEHWPMQFNNSQCKALPQTIRPYMDSTRPSIQALDALSSLPPFHFLQPFIDKLRYATTGDHKGFVATDTAKKAIIVSVRGTAAHLSDPGWLSTWLADIVSVSTVFGGACPVLRIEKWSFIPYITELPGSYFFGFCYFYNMMLLYTSYEEDLVAAVQEHPDYDLIFTGHSLGAAAASLAAADFLHRLRPHLRSELQGAPLRGEPLHGLPVSEPLPEVKATGKVLLYTFGEPRFGHPDAVAYLHNQLAASWRVTRHGDPIVLLPPSRAGAAAPRKAKTAYHQAQEVYYSGNGSHVLCDASGEDPTCSGQRSILLDFTLDEFMTGVKEDHNGYFPSAGWCCE